MSEKPDSSERTEEATPKKIEDALKKGQTPFSRELTSFATLLGALVVATLLTAPTVRSLVADLSRFLDDAGGFALEDGADATAVLLAAYRTMALVLVPAVAVLAAFGIAAAVAQTPPRVVTERITPKLERISVLSGFKRIFGAQGLAEFLRALFKFGGVGAVAVLILWAELGALVRAIVLDPAHLPGEILSLATRLLAAVCAATIVLVAADLVWTRFKWRRDLRMTRRELKDEWKQSEGDPILKSRMRSVQKDRSRRRMLSAVPRATVVIANPTHYAVALLYDRGAGGAPTVVAKGVDLVALTIREIAERHDVPVVEDPPLARALWRSVEVDRSIPEEFYRAVAQVLYFVYRREVRA